MGAANNAAHPGEVAPRRWGVGRPAGEAVPTSRRGPGAELAVQEGGRGALGRWTRWSPVTHRRGWPEISPETGRAGTRPGYGTSAEGRASTSSAPRPIEGGGRCRGAFEPMKRLAFVGNLEQLEGADRH